MKKIKKISQEIIRVKFKRVLSNKKIEYSRPIAIKKILFKETVYDNTGKILNQNNISEFFNMKTVIEFGKGLPADSFITEWKKGETPQPKRKEKNKGIEGKRRGHKRPDGWDANKASEMKQEHANIAYARAERREKKNQRVLGKANAKTGTVIVEFTGPNKERMTKTFPSKGLLRNNEFNELAKNFFDSTTIIKFKRKKGEREKEIAVSEEKRKNYKKSEKYLKRKQEVLERRKKEYDELAAKSVEHSKVKGKEITNIVPIEPVKEETDDKSIELVNAETNLNKEAA